MKNKKNNMLSIVVVFILALMVIIQSSKIYGLNKTIEEKDSEIHNLQIDCGIVDVEPYECPICGGKCNIHYDEYRKKYYISCLECGTRSDYYETKSEAIEKWNNRITEDEEK